MDKHLSESVWTCEPFDCQGMRIDRGQRLDQADLASIDEYKRYAFTPSGISPMARPGTPGGVFVATSDEHNERGDLCEDEPIRSRMMEKRLGKTASLDVSECGWKLHGDVNAAVTVVGWGSTASPIRGAVELLEKEGASLGFLQIVYMNPFPEEQVARVLGQARRTAVIENNATAQLADVIRERTGVRIEDTILKYSGRQWLVDELADRIRERL